MKVFSLTRVSSECQRDNQSTEVQEQKIAAFCLANSYTIAGTARLVETGGDMINRKQFNQVIKDFIISDCQALIVLRLDRFSRDQADLLWITKQIKQAGKHLISVEDNFTTLDEERGDLLLGLHGIIAQMERKRIKARCSEGKAMKLAKTDNRNLSLGGKVGIAGAISQDEYEDWIEQARSGVKYSEIAKKFNRHRMTVYRALKREGIILNSKPINK